MNPNQKKYQHIFFDLDHTLWDFETNSKMALNILFDDHLKNASFSFDAFFSYYQHVNAFCWKQYREGKMTKEILRVKRFSDAFAQFDVHDADLAHLFADGYLELSPYQTNLMPGAISLLDYLKNKGYTLHIITNGFEEVQSIKMRESGLNPYFDQIIISELLEHKKPHPTVFLHALHLANTEALTSAMVGDNLEADILGAQNVGVDGIFFNPNGQTHDESVRFEIGSLAEIENIL